MTLSDQLIVNNSLLVTNAARNGGPSIGLMRINADYDSRTGDERDKIDTLLNILNWISQCFVLEPRGDVVAVELETDPTKNTITLFLSHNEKEVNGAKKSATTQIQTVFSDIVTNLAATRVKGKKRLELDQLRDLILTTLVTVCWNRISRRVEMVVMSTPGSFKDKKDSINQFNTIIGIWSNFREDNNDPDWLSNAAGKIHKDRSKTVDVVKKLFADLVNMEPNMQKTVPIMRLEAFHKALCRASLILNSPFMIDMGSNDIRKSLKMNAFYFDIIDRIHRRLWKLFRYITGAEAFIEIGIPFFDELLTKRKRATNDAISKFNIDFKWIFKFGFESSKVMSEETELLETCTDWFKEKLNKVSKAVDANDKDREKRLSDKIMQKFSQEKRELNNNANIIFKNKIHCEVNLILFSMINHIDVQYRAIGVSKLMCWSCTQFVQEMEGKTNTKWNISGTSGKFYHQWHIPNAEAFKPQINLFKLPPPEDPESKLIPGEKGPKKPPGPTLSKYVMEVAESMKVVMKNLDNELVEALKENLKPQAKTTHKRMVSDSTTGSKWTILVDEPTTKNYIPAFSKTIMDKVLM